MRVQGTCWPPRILQNLSYVDATLNIGTDIAFAVLIPVPLFWHLNVSTGKRVYLITILGLGILACAACIIRLAHLYSMASYNDFLWDSGPVTIWVAAELNTGIVAGSVPAIKPCVLVMIGHKSREQNRPKRTLSSSVTTIGSHRPSWRILAGEQRDSFLLASSSSSGRRPPLNVVLEDGHMYELENTRTHQNRSAPEGQGRKKPGPMAMISEDVVVGERS